MPDKLTDSEIVKALKHCYEHKGCGDCLGELDGENCILTKNTAEYIYPIINRLQAENERLEEENEKQYEIARDTIRAEIADGGTSCHWCEDTIRGVAKAEAYKEFWSELKKHARKMQSSDFSGEFWDKAVLVSDIDNLLKELIGE